MNPTILRRGLFEQVVRVRTRPVAGRDRDMAPSLPVSAVIDAGGAAGYGAWFAWMGERYRLDEEE
ncbi:MAG: hypothetical protein OXF33_10610 [Rhodospirillales bacterium]|nr:hypothetical protein [Rhodospirillales bacterium]